MRGSKQPESAPDDCVRLYLQRLSGPPAQRIQKDLALRKFKHRAQAARQSRSFSEERSIQSLVVSGSESKLIDPIQQRLLGAHLKQSF